LESRPHRLLTPSEFAEQIQLRMSKKDASAFIDAHRGTYYDWKRTRITAQQITYIRQLEGRLSNIYTPKAVIQAVDFDGDVFNIRTSSSHDERGDLQTQAYEGLTEYDLIQMSYEDASTFIDQLKSELADPMLRNTSFVDNSQDELNDKLATFDDVRGTGSLAHDETSARVKEFTILNDLIFKLEETSARVLEFTILNDLIFKLEAVAGWRNDELHDEIKENVLDGDGEVTQRVRIMIKEFMDTTIDRSNMERLFKSIGRLYTMTQDSVTATNIVAELANEVLAEAM